MKSDGRTVDIPKAARVIVNADDATTRLSRLLDDVERGADVVIARNGRPVACLVPVSAHRPRRPGALKGRTRIANDFDAPLPDAALTSETDSSAAETAAVAAGRTRLTRR